MLHVISLNGADELKIVRIMVAQLISFAFVLIIHSLNNRKINRGIHVCREIAYKEKSDQSLQEHYSVVAVEDEIIVGFGDIDKTGYFLQKEDTK